MTIEGVQTGPVESIGGEVLVPESVPNPIEEQALSLGWKPKEQFQGNPEEWRSAKDYIDRGELIGKIRSQSKQIQNIEKALQHVTTQNARVYANGYDAAITDLKAQRKVALSEGDLLRADDIADQIQATTDEKARAIQTAAIPARQLQEAGVDPEHAEWVKANPWYAQDRVLARTADSIAIDYINENKGQVSPQQVRVHVSRMVNEKILKQNRVTGAPSPDGDGNGSRRSTGGDSRLSKIESGLTEDEARIMKTIIRSTGMSKAEYLKQYSEAR